MKIKGYEFGNGRPVSCVPVVEQTEEKILEVIERMARQKVEMIEWRMDWYEAVNDSEAVKELLKNIAPYVAETVLLCTYRSRKQGGEQTMPETDYLTLNQIVAESGVADMVDLEFYEVSGPETAIKQLQEKQVKVICSNHNFKETPDIEEMKIQLFSMLEAGADFAKLAVMPERKQDVLHLMEAVVEVKEKYPGSHLIAMSMGKDGVITRLLGEWYGSEVTFAAFEKASAPGQMPCQQVAKIMKQIEECIR